jgi:hypothetical protein
MKEPLVDDHTILANDENFGNVSVCPGGVVHVNLVHLTLKFVPDDFEKFSELIAKAHVKLQHHRAPRNKPRLQVVSPDPAKHERPDAET